MTGGIQKGMVDTKRQEGIFLLDPCNLSDLWQTDKQIHLSWQHYGPVIWGRRGRETEAYVARVIRAEERNNRSQRNVANCGSAVSTKLDWERFRGLLQLLVAFNTMVDIFASTRRQWHSTGHRNIIKESHRIKTVPVTELGLKSTNALLAEKKWWLWWLTCARSSVNMLL